jgi:predicted alpha-1,2-mannosidase
MKVILKLSQLLSILIIGTSACMAQTIKQPIDYVDVFIGTSNSRWMLGPHATMPFGMVQLGPDNQDKGWMSGYEYAISSVSGFSHLHAWTMGGLRLMPTTTDLVVEDRPVTAPYKGHYAGYHSRVIKESEKAFPGYYSVFLYDHEVLAEMTSTTRCGFQKYTFPQKDESRILVDLLFPMEYAVTLNDAKITKVSNTQIEGYADCVTAGWNDYKLHFVLEFDKPFNAMHGWNEGKDSENINSISGKNDIGVYVTYKTKKGETISVKSGISLVSIEQAKLNLDTEINEPFGWDFDAVVKNARDTWNKLLGRIIVEGGTEENRTKFYTNLYRGFAAKQTWSDVNGKYVDPCENVQQLPAGVAVYGGDAFWNSYWNLNGMLSIISPEISNNWVITQMQLFEKTGWTGKGPTGLEYSGIMEGSHEMAQMLSAYQKGIYKGNPDQLYAAMKKNVTVEGKLHECNGNIKMKAWDYPVKYGTVGNPGLNDYIKYGYMPMDKEFTNKTLDYSFDDWCVAQMAKAIGNKKDYKYFLNRSQNYRNSFHPTLKFIVPKDSQGNWKENFSPFDNYNLVEGNSWQYTLYVPHDISGIVDIIGKDLFNERLETGFEKSKQHKYAAHALDRSGGRKSEYYVNHGNQINMQAAWLFNYSGKPWLTQKYSRSILDTY